MHHQSFFAKLSMNSEQILINTRNNEVDPPPENTKIKKETTSTITSHHANADVPTPTQQRPCYNIVIHGTACGRLVARRRIYSIYIAMRSRDSETLREQQRSRPAVHSTSAFVRGSIACTCSRCTSATRAFLLVDWC